MSDECFNTPDREELGDRLIDAGLREILGGKTPPDLSERILARATSLNATESLSRSDAMNGKSGRRTSTLRSWLPMAVAAALLVGVGLLAFLPAVLDSRPVARRPADAHTVNHSSPVAPSAPAADAPSTDLDSMFQQEEFGITAEAPQQQSGEIAAKPADESAPLLGVRQAGAQALTAAPTVEAKEAPTAGRMAGEPAVTQLYAVNGLQGAPSRNWAMSPGYGREAAPMARPGQLPRIIIAEEERLAKGQGPGLGGDQYARIVESGFKAINPSNTDNRLSTFSIDVDTASYANVRQFLMQSNMLPPPDAVRIEELINYFDYDYSPPTGEAPFDAHVETASCPWAPEHRLVRIGIKGREIERTARPQSNLVFLVDVSGSMDEPNKLPLLVEGLRLMTRELGENDRVSIVVYASSEGLALESTPGTEQSKILAALDQLKAGGSTAGGAGIQLAYEIAAKNFIKGGVNRVILCTDGDFNVGVTSPAELERMAEERAKDTGVFLTVLGFGRGNLNDAMMEQIADKGNGNYHYVDTQKEAKKVLVEEMSGVLVTIAKDVKIQVEFNPVKVAGYRLIGYENRVLAAEDFNDDKKDAGEIGAGHTVTALYEVVPAGKKVDTTAVDELKYQQPPQEPPASPGDEDDSAPMNDELLTLKIRYKAPDGDTSSKLEFPITDNGQGFAKASEGFKFASAVASFGMLLRNSAYKGNATYAAVAEIAKSASDRDPHGYRQEFAAMVERAGELSGQ